MKKFTLLSIALLLSFMPGLYGQKKIKIEISTEFGRILIKCDAKKAPITTNNFLRYIKSGLFDSACFYRVVTPYNQPENPVPIKVIQGGRYTDTIGEFGPISHEITKETGIVHRRGTISMARSFPGTATSEFFICLRREKELDFGGYRNKDRQGFAAFGKVYSGMRTVKKIYGMASESQYITPVIKIISFSVNENP
jgi:peptidyl-prolyl cis-trans isomerase A (cyclophilin A)